MRKQAFPAEAPSDPDSRGVLIERKPDQAEARRSRWETPGFEPGSTEIP